MYGNTLDFQCQQKSFNVKFNLKIDSLIGYFMLPLLMLTSEVLSLSIHSLSYLYHMLVKFEQNPMIRTTQKFELLIKHGQTLLTKRWRHFGRRFCS